MTSRLAKALSVATVTGAMSFALATPASASASDEQAPASADVTAVEQSQGIEPEEGTLFAEVEAAETDDEKRSLLENDGFTQVIGENGGEHYEKTVDGITLGWTITPEDDQSDDGIASPMWSVGWNNGPYVAATTSQWQNAAVNAGAIGTAACTFITLTFGAAACVAIGGVVTNEISNLDPNAAPFDCWELRSVSPPVVLPSNQC